MIVLSNIDTLFDGSSGEKGAFKRGMDLWIDGRDIHKVVPHDAALKNGNDLTLIDCQGHTVTPGIIDCHGHVTVLGLSGQEMDLLGSEHWLLYVEKILYTTLVDGGVTTMRDIGGATHLIKRLVEDGTLIGPRLKIAICMLSSTGGHADFRSFDRCHAELNRFWPQAPGRPSSVVDGPWECRKRVREIAACGADLIKLCTSPGVASPGDKLEHQDFSLEEIEAICSEAHARGLRVAAHAHSKRGIEMAIDAGVNDIQHISFMSKELVERADQKGCTVTPTSWVIQHLQTADLSPFVMEKAKQVAEHHHKATEYAHKGGLPILAGSDAVMPDMHGRNYRELGALMAEGLSAGDAWYAATGRAAAGIGQDDTGVLAPGKRADLLVANGDILSNPDTIATALVEVVKDGKGHRGGLPALPQVTFKTAVDRLVQRD